MYTVFADDKNIYNPLVEELSIINAKLDLELNKAGSFSFTVPPTNPYINSLTKLKTQICVYENNDLIFRGRVLDDQEKFNKTLIVKCEGELAFLNDSVQRPFEFKGTPSELFTYLITKHNESVDDFKKFKIGNITVTDPNNYISRSDSEYSSTLTLINQQLIQTLGGYIWFRHESDGTYIDYLEDFSTLNIQSVEFGKNLIDLNKYSKAKDVVTVVIPLGAKIKKEEGEEEIESRLTVAEVNNGKDYIENEEALKLRGRIEKIVTFDNVTDPLNLLRKGREWLGKAVLLAETLELTAVDLSSIDQSFNNFKIGSYVKVTTLPHNLDINMLVQKLSLDLQKPASNKLTLGTSFTSFTDREHDFNNKFGNIVESVENIKNSTIIISKNSPDDKNRIWCDIATDPPTFKKWDGEIWEIINDPTNDIQNIVENVKKEINSSIEQSANNITSTVEENYYKKGETDKLISKLSTEFSQSKDSFEMIFNNFQQDINDLENNTNSNFEDIRKYIRFVDGNIVLGVEGNLITLKIKNDRISFLENMNEVAYFANNKLYVLDGEFLSSLVIGRFGFIPRKNGHLSFRKVR